MAEAQRADVLSATRLTTYRSQGSWDQDGPSTLHVAVVGDRVLVLSGVLGQIEEFALDGTRLSTWGRKGRAEAELFGPVGFAVLKERVIVADVAAARLSRWSTDGAFIDEVSHEEISRINLVLGGSVDGLIVSKVLFTQDDEQQTISLVTVDGDEAERYVILPVDRNVGEDTVWPRPRAVVASDGSIYASTAASYRVHVFAPGGELRYVLEVDWPRAPVSDEVRRTVERTRRAGRALGANTRAPDEAEDMPSLLPALAGMEIDADDRLYVFPVVASSADRFPVDVYSRDGERLAAGWLPFQGWETQSGSELYRIERDPETGETIVVRYRLELSAE